METISNFWFCMLNFEKNKLELFALVARGVWFRRNK